MLSLYKIWTVARYETRTLWRSWFFRIFALMSLAILIFINVPFFALKGNTPWLLRGIPGSIPYLNILLLNTAQAIIAVFLASDFLKRDKKLDTTEVIYMRSMTNGDYVLGKLLGILLVFLALNIVVLIIAAIYNIFFSDVPFVLLPYLWYPLLISLPTLIFIFGLSFLFMVTIRNQAVTFVLLLGYIFLTLFFLGQKSNFLFDYLTFNVPLMYSDFVGIANLGAVLIHRGIYFLLGLGFVFATILLIKRLPQSNMMTRVSAVLAVLFLGSALVLAFIFIQRSTKAISLRQQIMELNKKANALPRVSVQKCQLELQHLGNEIKVQARLQFRNNTATPIDRYVFSLNPGLQVERIAGDQSGLPFARDLHLLTVTPRSPLAPQATDSLTIWYQGTIDERVGFVEVDEKVRATPYKIGLSIFSYNIAKRFSFIEPQYVLLTPEALWYPVAGLPYGASYPQLPEKDFVDFQLQVTTESRLTAISQGQMVASQNGRFSFHSDKPIPQLTLSIGNYEHRSVTVDGVDYALFHLKGHDYFSPYFKDIGDTLSALIRDAKQRYENKLGLSYPFPRLLLVEVPIQFFPYPRNWTSATEAVQPEMLLLSEKGVLIDQADFSRMTRWQERMRERSNQTLTPQEMQSRILSGLIDGAFLGGFGGMRMFMGNMVKATVNYEIFPNYFTYVNNFHSGDWPIFNVALESFLIEKSKEGAPPFRRFFIALSDEEKANLALRQQSLAEILVDPKHREIVNTVIKTKGAYLFRLLESKLGKDPFRQFLLGILTQNQFNNTAVADIISQLQQRFSFDLAPHFQNWYHGKQLPAFIIADVNAYKVLDRDRTRYQVKFKIANPEPVNGLVAVTFRTGRGGPQFFGMGRMVQETPIERLIPLEAGQAKEIGIVLDDSPRNMSVNTLISQNLPVVINRGFEELELNEKAQPFDGERVLPEPLTLALPNEVIVDNEDPGFQSLYSPSKSWLKRLIEVEKEEEKYIGLVFWNAPSRWRATTFDNFYGKYVRSAHYIKAGKGDKKVAWNTTIEKSGNYEIYYYVAEVRMPWMRRDRGERGRDRLSGQLQFLVYHDDGVEDVTLDLNNAEEGWNLLGTHYLSAGPTKVELTDKSKGQIVFADAVKWVRR